MKETCDEKVGSDPAMFLARQFVAQTAAPMKAGGLN